MAEPILRHFDAENPEIAELTRWLLEQEEPQGDVSGTDLHAAFRVCQRLRHPIATFTGVDGFRSLLSRAVSLAKAQAPWLLEQEEPQGDVSGTDLHAAFRVCQRLRHPIATFTGVDGFRSLLSRAVSLAKAQAPLLAAVRVNGDGTFDLLEEAEPLFEGNEASHAGRQLVSELLSLLITFIGPPLMLRLVRLARPNVYEGLTAGEHS